MLKVRDDRPLDVIQLDILRYLNATFQKLGTDYFVIGATARDIMLNHVFGIAPRRATVDIDFAIALTSWDEFQDIRRIWSTAGTSGSAAQRFIDWISNRTSATSDIRST